MPTPDNIAFFNRFALALFDRLYGAFPVPVDLKVDDIAMTVLQKDDGEDEAWDALVAAGDAVEFLAQEGFLTHKGTYLEGGTFLQARLTLKGLAILGYTTDALGARQPLITRIQAALSGGAKEAGSETVRQLVQQAFTAALAAGPAIAASLAQP